MSEHGRIEGLTKQSRGRTVTRRTFLARLATLAGSVGVGMSPRESRSAAPVSRAPEPTGKVTLVMPEEPNSLSSWESVNIPGSPILRNMQEALLNRDPKTNQLVGELATKWERSSPTAWRFILRRGVKFHDGSPFNAEAAAFGINHMWSKQNKFNILEYMGPQISAKAIDEYTLEVSTETPDPVVPERLYFSPLPSMKALKERPEEYKSRPIGTGPYRFVEWQKGQYVKMEANRDWWGRTADDARGVVTIKEGVFVAPRPEGEVRAAMVKAGEADLARWITRQQAQSCPKYEHSPSNNTIFIRPDSPGTVLKDLRVRRAISLAIDRKSIMDQIVGGGQPAGMMVGPAVTGYDSNLTPDPYDPARAKSLVAAAKADGVPVGNPLTLYVRQGIFPGFNEAAEAIINSLNDIGLSVKLQVADSARINDVLSARKPIPADRGAMVLHLHGNQLLDFSRTASGYFTSDARQSVEIDPKIDELAKKASPLTGEMRVKAYQELGKYIYDRVLFIPVGRVEFFFGLSSRLDWKPRLDGFILLKEMALKG